MCYMCIMCRLVPLEARRQHWILELQVVSAIMGVLGTKCESTSATSALSQWTISPAPMPVFSARDWTHGRADAQQGSSANLYPRSSSFIFRPTLSKLLRQSLDSPYSPGKLWIRDPPASASWVASILGLLLSCKVCWEECSTPTTISTEAGCPIRGWHRRWKRMWEKWVLWRWLKNYIGIDGHTSPISCVSQWLG